MLQDREVLLIFSRHATGVIVLVHLAHVDAVVCEELFEHRLIDFGFGFEGLLLIFFTHIIFNYIFFHFMFNWIEILISDFC